MASLNGILKNKRGTNLLLEIIIVGVLILIIVIVLIHSTIKAKEASKFSCTVSLGIAKGYCVKESGDCEGVVNPAGTGCPKEKPVCCVGTEGEEESKTAKTSTPPATKTPEQPKPEPVLKGNIQFYCKCRLENGHLVPANDYANINIPAIKEGEVDFTVYKDTTLEMQARGTDDIKYCNINVIQNKVVKRYAGGSCSITEGLNLTFDKFTVLGDFDIGLYGYDKKDGKMIADAVVDVKVEEKSAATNNLGIGPVPPGMQ